MGAARRRFWVLLGLISISITGLAALFHLSQAPQPARRQRPPTALRRAMEPPKPKEKAKLTRPLPAPKPKPKVAAAPAKPAIKTRAVSPDARRLQALLLQAANPKEREQLRRHLRRFVEGKTEGGRRGGWVDRQLRAVAEHSPVEMKSLPIAKPDEAEARRIEQLEKLRQRKAVSLLDHIHAGLAWLALHQSEDGHVSSKDASKRCAALKHASCLRYQGKYDTAATALATMALLDFRDQDVTGLFEPHLARAVTWLVARQNKSDGSFPGRRQLYSNAIAVMALAQAAASTRDPKVVEAARLGLHYFERNAGSANGFRYRLGQPGDLSVTGWVAQAYEMGRKAKLGPFPELHRNLDTFFDSIWIVDHRFNYLVGYRERPTLAPVGMLMGHILWEEPEPYFLDLWRRYLRTPRSVAGGNLYTLYYGVRVAILLEQGIPEPWRTHVFKLAKAQ
ncbi:MAG: hypothetical protein ACYSX0_16050, partial [Planctomycetota bacterium]